MHTPLIIVTLFRADSAPLPTPAEVTPTPGLVVAPSVGAHGRFHGTWAVTHTASGWRVCGGHRDIHQARALAAAPGTVADLDWTTDLASLRRAVPAYRAELDHVRDHAGRDA